MRKPIVPHTPKTHKSRAYKESQINKMAREFIKALELSEDLFSYDNWPEIILAAYTKPNNKYPEPLPRHTNNSKEHFRNTGHKYSIVFQKKIKGGGGELRPLVIELKGIDLDSLELPEIVAAIKEYPIFSSLVFIHNVQRGQEPDSVHLHLWLWIPDKLKIPERIRINQKYYTVKNDVGFNKGRHEGQPVEIQARKIVQYSRFPVDQRYRGRVDGCKAESYREAYEINLERLETGIYKHPVTFVGISDEMKRLIKQVTPEEIAKELAEFEEYVKSNKEYRKQKKAHKEYLKERQERSENLEAYTLFEEYLQGKDEPAQAHRAELNKLRGIDPEKQRADRTERLTKLRALRIQQAHLNKSAAVRGMLRRKLWPPKLLSPIHNYQRAPHTVSHVNSHPVSIPNPT